MQPYYSIINESKYDENAGFHYFLFNWSHDTYVALEYYCINPECDCTSVILQIDRVTPSGTTENIGYLSIGIPDFRVEEIKAKHKAVYQSKLNKEFKQGIPEEWRPFILKHRNHVRELIGVMKRGGKQVMVKKQQSVAARSATIPGRNDPCSCGSGKKYKKCCGAAGG